LLEEGANHSFV